MSNNTVTQTETSKVQLWWQKFYQNWLAYQSEDSGEARKGTIISIVTFSFWLTATLSAIGGIIAGVQIFDNLWTLLIVIAIFGGLYVLARKGYLNLVGFVTVGAVILFSSNPIGSFENMTYVGYLIMALAVVLSGLVIGPKSMFITALFVALIGWYVQILQAGWEEARRLEFILFPIYLMLALIIYMMWQGRQSALDNVQKYADELELAKQGLEIEVQNRTKDLAISFDLSRQLSQIMVSTRDTTNLFQQMAKLLQTTFNYYYVSIYTYSPIQRRLFLSYGSGTVGRLLKQQGYGLNLGQGLIGVAAESKKPLIVNDVSQSADYMMHTILPDTKSEMVIPLLQEGQLLGVLDIQHNIINGFSEIDRDLIIALANQLTVALHNLQLVAEAQEAVATVEALNRKLVEQQWEKTLAQASTSGYTYSLDRIGPSETDWLPGMSDALQQERLLTPANNGGQATNAAIPVKLRGGTIGVLGIERDSDDPWTEDELVIIQTISEQIALALESARLFEDTGRRAARERIISDMTRQVWASGSLEKVMQSAVEQFGKTLDASRVIIQLGTSDKLLKPENAAQTKNSVDVDKVSESVEGT